MIGSILVLLLGLAVALLAIPLDLRILVETSPQLRYRIALRVWFGCVQHVWSGPASARRPAQRSRRAPSRRRRRPLHFRGALSSFTSPAFLDALGRLARRTLRGARVNDASVALRIGLDDPAGTAQLFGYLCALDATAGGLPVAREIHPEFQRAVLALRISAGVRIHCLLLLWSVLAFAIEPGLWRVVKGLRYGANRGEAPTASVA